MKSFKKIHFVIMALFLILIPFSIQAQDNPPDPAIPSVDSSALAEEAAKEASKNFGFGLGLGATAFDDGVYQTIKIAPELAFGEFGIALNIDFNFQIAPSSDPDKKFKVRAEDWYVPGGNFRDHLELYFSKFKYVRWGQKGKPLYIKLGSLEGATLGNGYILGNYDNTLLEPDRKITGLVFDLDGRLFKFPYIGIETFFSNITAFDVFGGRFFVRPIYFLDNKLLKNLQIGISAVLDTQPFFLTPIDSAYNIESQNYISFRGYGLGVEPIIISGLDFRLPLLNSKMISLAVFGDYVIQGTQSGLENAKNIENASKTLPMGGMLGTGGRLVKFLLYGAQLRFIGRNFIPTYFDQRYDLYRPDKLAVITGLDPKDPTLGWFASLGTAFLDDRIIFKASLEGAIGEYPDLRGDFIIKEKLIPYFSLNFFYDKSDIESGWDLISPEDALIGGALNYKMGPAVISLTVDAKYNPHPAADEKKWDVSSGVTSEIKF